MARWSRGSGAGPAGEEGVMVMAQVPADGPVRLGSVQLPVGRRISEWHDAPPRLWATAQPVPNAGGMWQALTDLHPDTGLVPILLGFLDGGHEGRPWDNGELGPRCDLAAVGQLDAATVLAREWAGSVPTAAELEDPEWAAMVAPYGEQFPGLAAGQGQALTEAELARALGWLGPARIGLVPAFRPADVLALVGYDGTVNGYGTPELLSVALRSWEERFGAVLAEVGFAHIRLLARRPPRTLEDAQAVAAELWSFCDEFWPIDKPGTAVRDVGSIAQRILDIPIWSLWLD
jgi:hypothetical protein